MQIDTQTPMPEFKPQLRYPFADMVVGNSLVFTSESKKESARIAARQFVRTHQPTWRFRSAKVGQEWRLFRVA